MTNANKPNEDGLQDLILVEIDFGTIYEIWSKLLWPNRQSQIEPLSAISDDLSIDINILKNKAYYIAYKSGDKIVGVLSGHPTGDSSYRLRGLYVIEEFRNKGLATLLMQKQIEHAKELDMKCVWLMGRVAREPLYAALGFEVVCRTEKFEFGPHYLMKKYL